MYTTQLVQYTHSSLNRSRRKLLVKLIIYIYCILYIRKRGDLLLKLAEKYKGYVLLKMLLQ
jgi:hypothetical protein